MEKIIEELWYGNIFPQESDIFNAAEFKKLLSRISDYQVELEKNLGKEQKEVLEKLLNARNEYGFCIEKTVFVCGFKLGGKIVAEIMCD